MVVYDNRWLFYCLYKYIAQIWLTIHDCVDIKVIKWWQNSHI